MSSIPLLIEEKPDRIRVQARILMEEIEDLMEERKRIDRDIEDRRVRLNDIRHG